MKFLLPLVFLFGCGAAPVPAPELPVPPVSAWICTPKDSPAETGVQIRLKGASLQDLEFLFETVDGTVLYFKSVCLPVP